MSLLKMFRRCVAPVLDTEATKKLKNSTLSFVDNYGSTFKPIEILQKQFAELDTAKSEAEAAGETKCSSCGIRYVFMYGPERE